MRQHGHTFRVIYGDTDTMGVVYYANYFRYFEAGRNELLRAAGLDYRSFEAMGYMLPVIDAHAKYLSPARYDDELLITTQVTKLRRGSVILEYELVRPLDKVTIATGGTTHACLGPTGRVTRVPDALRDVLVSEASP